MKIGIIAAMEEELKLLVENLGDKTEYDVLGNTYYEGKLGNHQVVLVQSGIGKVMSAMSVAILSDHFGVDAVINTGSAGAVAPGLKIGDVVVADKLVYHDVDVTALVMITVKWLRNHFILNQTKTLLKRLNKC